MLFLLLLLVQSPDPHGWQNVKWGMTVSQACGKCADNTISNVRLGDYEGDASLIVKHGIVSAVVVAPRVDGLKERAKAFEYLKLLLTAKYGAPKVDKPGSAVWTFPSTIVKLIHEETDINFGYVHVEYLPGGRRRYKTVLNSWYGVIGFRHGRHHL